MKIPRRIKFIWGASQVIRGQWFLGLVGLYDRREGKREDGIVVSVRGMLAWGAVFGFVGWVALATAGFWIWQRNPYTLLTYGDALLYPLRSAAIAEKKGQAFIAQGQDLARAGRWYDAANLLRLGLARYPRDFRARLTLARFYQLTNQSSAGLKILKEGLADEYPGRSYLDALFKLAIQGEDFAAVVDLCVRYLPVVKRDALAAEHRWLVEKRYGALTAAERHAEALAVAETEAGGDVREERRVLSLLALRRTQDALAVLAEWRKRPGADLNVVVRLEVRALREAGRLEEMEERIGELRQRLPAEAATHVYGIVQRAMAGRGVEAGAALAEYVFRFGGFAENLLLVAAPLAEIGNLPLLQQCAEAARERGFPLTRMHAFLFDTHLGRGEWDEAGRILEALPHATTGKDAVDKTWREWLQLLIEAGKNSSEAPQRSLVEFLRGRAWTMALYRRTAATMLRAERLETARDILDLALRAYPSSQWAQTTAADVRERLAAQAAAQAAEPAGTVAPTSAEAIFGQRLDYLLRIKNWTEAERHLAQTLALAPAPDWLEGREAAIRLARVRIAQGRRDLPALREAAQRFLNGSVVRSQELHALAGEIFSAGDRAGAIALTREILHSTPGFAVAQRSLREWDPTAEPAAAVVRVPEARAEAKAGAQPEALVAQLRERQAAGDVPGVLTAVRLLLNGERVRAELLLTIAREWAAAGEREAAERVVREVLRRHEGFPPARRLLNELTPGGAAKR